MNLPVAAGTATAMIRAVHLVAGDTVVVAAGAGGVGTVVVQLERLRGARVIATASEENHPALRAFGVEPVTYGNGLEARIHDLAPEGVDAFLDTYRDGNADLALALGVDPARVDTIVDFPAGKRLGIKIEGICQLDDIRSALIEAADLPPTGAW